MYKNKELFGLMQDKIVPISGLTHRLAAVCSSMQNNGIALETTLL